MSFRVLLKLFPSGIPLLEKEYENRTDFESYKKINKYFSITIKEPMNKMFITVNDLMQNNYTYQLVEPTGSNFDPLFKPELSPKEMLELGVFGGKYMTDCKDEFPKDWFKNAKLCHDFHNPKLNYFGVNASQPLSLWREKGWIYCEDPRGGGGFNGIVAITWVEEYRQRMKDKSKGGRL